MMLRVLSHSAGPAGISVSDPFTTFTEQAISVLRLTVDRMHAGEIGGMQVDISDLLLNLAQYINRLGRIDIALRIKIRFCHLSEAVLSRPDFAVVSNIATFRNAALEMMCEWSSEGLRVCKTAARHARLIPTQRKQRPSLSTWNLLANHRASSITHACELWCRFPMVFTSALPTTAVRLLRT